MPTTTLCRPDLEWADEEPLLRYDDDELDDPEAEDDEDYGLGEDVEFDEEDIDLDEEFDEADQSHDAE